MFAPIVRITTETTSMFFSLRQLQREGIAPSDSTVRRLIKEGKLTPPFQRGRGSKRVFSEDHRDELLGIKKPKPAVA
jgi:hypothetical protein